MDKIAALESQNQQLKDQAVALQNRCVDYEGQIERLDQDFLDLRKQNQELRILLDDASE